VIRMPLEYKKTFNPGEHLWPVAVKLSQSDVAQRPNTEIVSLSRQGFSSTGNPVEKRTALRHCNRWRSESD
jgi:hypothetical protein